MLLLLIGVCCGFSLEYMASSWYTSTYRRGTSPSSSALSSSLSATFTVNIYTINNHTSLWSSCIWCGLDYCLQHDLWPPYSHDVFVDRAAAGIVTEGSETNTELNDNTTSCIQQSRCTLLQMYKCLTSYIKNLPFVPNKWHRFMKWWNYIIRWHEINIIKAAFQTLFF